MNPTPIHGCCDQPTHVHAAMCHYCDRPWHFPAVVFSADGSEAVGEPICTDCAAASIADSPADDHGYDESGVRFNVGSAMCGYMPDEVPWLVDDAKAAQRAMIAELLSDADRQDEIDAHDIAEEYDAAAQLLNVTSLFELAERGWSTVIADREYWITPTTD